MTSADLGHAQLMDRQYRFQRHVYDLSRRYYLLGRLHLVEKLQPARGGSVLEMGCGTGWNMARVLERYPDANVFGSDISEAMLATARAKLARFGAQRVQLAQGDATVFDPVSAFNRRHFDRVYISYAVSMIPPWREAIRHATSLVAPGGTLSIVDFGSCEGWPRVMRSGLYSFLAAYHVTPRTDLDAVLRELAAANGWSLTTQQLYRGYATYAELRRPA
jgi:S-adenosylmethionine-diacylgycerolhomoserine-N-methlytransferase